MIASTTNAMQERTSPSIEYITTLSVNLQRADEDSGLYTVIFNISSGNFIIGVSATESRNIVVQCELHNRLRTLILVNVIFVILLPARAREQGNVIGLVSVYNMYVVVIKKNCN